MAEEILEDTGTDHDVDPFPSEEDFAAAADGPEVPEGEEDLEIPKGEDGHSRGDGLPNADLLSELSAHVDGDSVVVPVDSFNGFMKRTDALRWHNKDLRELREKLEVSEMRWGRLGEIMERQASEAQQERLVEAAIEHDLQTAEMTPEERQRHVVEDGFVEVQRRLDRMEAEGRQKEADRFRQEIAAHAKAFGAKVSELKAEIPDYDEAFAAWRDSVHASFRSQGFTPAQSEQAAQEYMRALVFQGQPEAFVKGLVGWWQQANPSASGNGSSSAASRPVRMSERRAAQPLGGGGRGAGDSRSLAVEALVSDDTTDEEFDELMGELGGDLEKAFRALNAEGVI